MHTRRFTDAKGNFWLHNKRAGKTYASNPKQAFCEKHLYTKEDSDGVKYTDLETWFSVLEGSASIIIQKILDAVRTGNTPTLSEVEIEKWAKYFYMLWKRTPDALTKVATLKQADDRLTELFAEMAARSPEAAAEVAKLDTPEERKRLIQGSKVGAIERVPGNVQAVFASRGIRILHITEAGLQFAIGSLPIVRKAGSLEEETAEVWLPIAPDVAVGVGGAPGSIEIVQVNDTDAIQAFNRVTAAQSTSFASASQALIDELVAFLRTLPKTKQA